MSDLISRQAAINEISRWLGYLDDDMILRIQMGLRKLPSVQHVATDTNAGDTISRQAVIDAIFSEPLYKSGMKKRDVDVVVPAIYKKIKSLPSVQPEQRWIPCSERLPEPGYCITSNEYYGVDEDFYYDGHFWNADKNAYEVIAWMPLPKPYEEGDTT